MDLLKRSHAPITDRAWNVIDDVAKRALRTNLKSRRIVDVVGPKGWDFPAVSLGRLNIGEGAPRGGVEYGVYRTQPLVEFRVRFSLDLWELDNLTRGARDVDLDPLIAASQTAAHFEDSSVFVGFPPGCIQGLSESAQQEPLPLPLEVDNFLDTVSKGVLELERASVEGPYALVLGPKSYRVLASAPIGHPLTEQVESILAGGSLLESDLLDGGFLLSMRGGDFELTIGQDFSIGYETHDTKSVRLFLTESFTFQVLEPQAALELKHAVPHG